MAASPQEPIRGRSRGGVLGLHHHPLVDEHAAVGADAIGVEQLPGQGLVEGGAGVVVGQVERGALVSAVHDGHQRLRDVAGLLEGAGLGLHQALDDEFLALFGDAVGVVGTVLQPVLDRCLARTIGLDLQEAQVGVQVSAGADLVATTALVGGQEEGVQSGGVEVGGGVLEVAQSVDLQDLCPRSEDVDDVLDVVRRHQVLAVHAGEQARFGIELGEGDGVEVLGAWHVAPPFLPVLPGGESGGEYSEWLESVVPRIGCNRLCRWGRRASPEPPVLRLVDLLPDLADLAGRSGPSAQSVLLVGVVGV